SVSSLFGATRQKATTCYHLRSSAKIGTLYGKTTARPMRKKSYDEFAFRCISVVRGVFCGPAVYPQSGPLPVTAPGPQYALIEKRSYSLPKRALTPASGPT